MTVLPVGEFIFSDKAIVISIEDEGGGEYIQIRQQMEISSDASQTVGFDPDEWEEVKGVVDQMFKDIKDYQDETRTDVQQS
jgi:hypothetical protein